jgi:hypothetical protein
MRLGRRLTFARFATIALASSRFRGVPRRRRPTIRGHDCQHFERQLAFARRGARRRPVTGTDQAMERQLALAGL